ncbi:MAG TPA: EAL domain-containing response regulator [Polyangiaceae bacterium]|nr:EAL domain-containing response regulator [Polyangiaceae bacterium]
MQDDVRDLVLLIDDDFSVRKMHAKVLTRAGFTIEAAAGGAPALALLQAGLRVGAIVTDLHMPGIDGLAFMRAVRKIDMDVPVIVVTGYPSFDSAVRVIEYGGFRYLTKPAPAAELVGAVRSAVSMHRLALLKRRALELYESERWHFGDRASLEASFEEALDHLWMAFQPIVNHRKREIVGYEALVRSGHPQLSNPGMLLGAGERLGRIGELGQRIRKHVVDALDAAPIETSIFINLHAADLNDDSLFSTSSSLCAHATRVVLEITERSSLDRVTDVKGRAEALRRLGYKIAIDDLGAGYAGLSSFAQLDPDIAKLDMSLVRDIDASEQKRKIVRSMLQVCTEELGVRVVCEGVETVAERDALDELGSDIQQGYLFGRPQAGFVPPAWSILPAAPAEHA